VVNLVFHADIIAGFGENARLVAAIGDRVLGQDNDSITLI